MYKERKHGKRQSNRTLKKSNLFLIKRISGNAMIEDANPNRGWLSVIINGVDFGKSHFNQYKNSKQNVRQVDVQLIKANIRLIRLLCE